MAKKKRKKSKKKRTILDYKKRSRYRIASINSRNYRNPQYIRWRKSVYARDNYKCKWPGCKSTSKKINAHHIKKWASYPLLRFIITNGITLCWDHHDSIKGKEEMYEKFFNDILSQELIKKIEELEKKHEDTDI